MTEESALIAAVRAEASAQAAHHRLDRMNGSIDKLTETVNTKYGAIDAKLDGVLLHLASLNGADTQKKLAIDSRRFVITTLIAALAVIVALVVAVIYRVVTG